MPLHEGPSLAQVTLINAGAITSGNTGVTTALETHTYEKKTIYVKSSGACTVYVKGGVDSDNMCFGKTGDLGGTEDEDLSWSCDTELICFPIYTHMDFLQVVVDNTEGADITVSVWFSGG